MNQEKKKKTQTLYERISVWLRKPENILLLLLLLTGTVIGIIDDNAGLIVVIYIFAFLYGLFIRLIFYIINYLKEKLQKTEKRL